MLAALQPISMCAFLQNKTLKKNCSPDKRWFLIHLSQNGMELLKKNSFSFAEREHFRSTRMKEAIIYEIFIPLQPTMSKEKANESKSGIL